MRVKRLELQGFKSFKDKTVIHFDDGVTGIVGPNGCGKSNIVDAFFWVMGEQSTKHMRADGQLDLIFNGSTKYAPSNLAEVTLVLSTDAKSKLKDFDGATTYDLPPHLKYEEISITRRLYRDNQSEYFINGVPCRLKDIHELFMDTGAGPKAYSIIEQGQIAKIIQSKPEDRRVLIEEAAGIVKFKARKKESQRKIEATQQNLARINDIITEIERNLSSLERQAQKAKQYKLYKEELLSKEMLVGRKKLFDLKNSIQNSSARIQQLETLEIEKRSEYQTVELRIENIKIQATEIQRKIEDIQQSLTLVQKEISDKNTNILLHQRRLEELANSSVTLEEELESLNKALIRYNEEIEILEKDEQAFLQLVSEAENILSEKQARLNQAKQIADELGREVEVKKRELLEVISKKSEISNQVHGLEARVDSLSVQISSLNTKLSDRNLDFENVTEKLSQTRENFARLKELNIEARQAEENLKVEVEKLNLELKDLRSTEENIKKEGHQVEAKLKALGELIQNHDDLKADVKAILNDEPLIREKVQYVFADIISAHEGYELAVEAVLKDFFENLILENSKEANEFLKILKEKSLGRGAFWPKDFIKKSLQKSKKTESEILSLLQSNEIQAVCLKDKIKIQNLDAEEITQFFENVFVVENLEQAMRAFELCSQDRLVFVTKEGDYIDAFGRVVGGSNQSLQTGLLAKKLEFERLTQKANEIKIQSDELNDKIKALETTLNDKKLQLEEATLKAQELNLQYKTTERDLFALESQYEQLQKEINLLKSELEKLEKERQGHWEKLDAIRIEHASLEDSTKLQEQEIEEKDLKYKEAQSHYAEIQAEIVQFKVDASTAQEKLKNTKNNLEKLRLQKVEDLKRKEEVESLINRKLDEKDFVAQELEVFNEEMHALVQKAQVLENQISEQKNEYEIVTAQANELHSVHRSLMKEVEEITTELNKLKVDKERYQVEYEMLYQSMFQRYGLEESQIAPQNDEDERAFKELTPEKEQLLQEEVDRLHEKIRKLGEVNVMADEEYNEQKKRYDFLVSQREDLNRSIEDLEKAIERINKTSEERFKVAFEEINSRFQRIFPIVFGGGWGKLELTNPNDLNETGVEIIAEPPGKKVSSIQLMSGGEKALTSVALIFSIFLIKPSPFCVLDEVDAPLDDHNVGKFNALLKEMSARSQFIIITHNKRTMELNDKLYGVTMEEPGVSKMVSIRVQ